MESEEGDQDIGKKFADLNASKFSISDISIGERVSILGKTGSGKSWFGCFIINQFAKKQPVFILDVKDEYAGVEEAGDDWLKKEKGIFKITNIEYQGHDIRDFHLISEYVFQNAFNKGNICIVAEEIGEYVKKSGRLWDVAPEFAKYLTQGRKRNCSLVAITQRTQDMHTSVLSQSEHIFCFKLGSPHDLEAVKKYFQDSWFSGLKDFQFFHKNINDSTVRKRFGLFTKQTIFGLKMLGKDRKIRLSE